MLTSEVVQGFVTSCLAKKFDQGVPTPHCHKEWWELCTSGAKLIAIAAPRGHAKSTAVTMGYLMAELLFRQSKFALIVSDTEAQAAMFLGDIKQELIENEDIVSLFGIKQFNKLNETDIIVECNDGYRFRLIAKGAEQKLRGIKWESLRPDLIVIDDLENDEIVMNKERREKLKRWFYGALLPCRSPGGKIRMVGTILHMDSLLENLMPKVGNIFTTDKDLRADNFKNPRKLWSSVRYRAHNADFSKVLWPDRHSAQALQEIRQDFIDQGMPDVYSREYLNYPIDEEYSYFRREDFLPMNENNFEAKKNIFAAIDFAVSTAERSDYTVIAIAGLEENGTLDILDVRRGRWDSADVVQEMLAVQQRYQPDLFITEKGAIEKAIGPFLKAEMLRTKIYLNLDSNTPTKDKMSRARSFQARLRAGSVRFDKDAEWYLALEEELIRFPKDRHDDQVDALSWIGLKLDAMVEPPTKQEEEEEEYMEYLIENASGRSKTTGY